MSSAILLHLFISISKLSDKLRRFAPTKGNQVALFDISISNIDCRYIVTFEKYRYRYGHFENIDIDKAILENIDIKIDIDKAILINIDIDIDRKSLKNIDIDIDKGIIKILI